jgi:hypothetical protein
MISSFSDLQHIGCEEWNLLLFYMY